MRELAHAECIEASGGDWINDLGQVCTGTPPGGGSTTTTTGATVLGATGGTSGFNISITTASSTTATTVNNYSTSCVNPATGGTSNCNQNGCSGTIGMGSGGGSYWDNGGTSPSNGSDDDIPGDATAGA